MKYNKELVPKDIMKFSHDFDEVLKGLNMFNGLIQHREIRTTKK
jgi:hypothetical protein